MKPLYNFRNKPSFTLLVLLIAMCAVSCVVPGNTGTVPLARQKDNLLYSSNSLNMPILQKKGSGLLNVLGSFGNSGSTLNGAEVQGAIATGKNIGIQVNGFYAGRKNQEAIHNNNAGYIDAAVGYFHGLKDGFSMEVYGGIGTGTTSNYHYTGYSKIRNTKFFLQPSIGYSSKNGKFKAATGFRFSENKFLIKEQIFDINAEPFTANEFRLLSMHPNQFFVEPSALLRYGWKDFQFQFQYSGLIQTGGWNYNMGKSRWTLGCSIPF